MIRRKKHKKGLVMDTQENINITPGPRILRMLGEIDFKAWQCLCEIIDNSIDAFSIADTRLGNEKQPLIKIRLPATTANSLKVSDTLTIEDNAEGMTLASLENSLKAGFSANNPVDKMGLFGMGFNIATARLGVKTDIITATKDSSEILTVTIDFRELEKKGSYDIPVVRTKKLADEIDWHGTIVNITQLRTEHIIPLFQRKHIGTKLGKIYGRVLREKNIKISYDGTSCKPFIHCKWAESRQGQGSHGIVPAIIKIDQLIDESLYCNTCWIWLNDREVCCPVCAKTSEITKRERRVKGWIGLQRYFHSEHYGFDLIRNGRVITELDKSFFYMLNQDEEQELEYPVDGFQMMGRFIGELEIDFVKVTHQKDAFDKNTKDWKDVVRVVRGESPIRPNIAKSMGYVPNKSPLALLFSAFRKSTGGIKNLVPTKNSGEAMLKDPILDEYLYKFNAGETDYQSDDKWWNLVNRENTVTSGSRVDNDPTGGDPFAPMGGSDVLQEISNGSQVTGETLQSNTANSAVVTELSNRDKIIPDIFLSKNYSLDIFKNVSVRVIAQQTNSSISANGFQVKPKGAEITFTYWPDDPVFDENLLNPADFLVNELAYHMHKTAHNEVSLVPLSEVELRLREKYFPNLHPTCQELLRRIRDLSDELKVHLKSKTESNAKLNISLITSDEMKKLKKRLQKNKKVDEAQVSEAMEKGEFLTYASFSVMRCIVSADPKLVFDGEFFDQNWSDVETSSASHTEDHHELNGLLMDVEWFDENHAYPGGHLWRARVKRLIGSLEIIASWRAGAFLNK